MNVSMVQQFLGQVLYLENSVLEVVPHVKQAVLSAKLKSPMETDSKLR